jgi:hypothetical protein
MRNGHDNNKGFSLAEVLLAVCTMAIGMIFVAGVFPAGVLFTTIATERTIAAVVADEAFAKIRLYGGINPSWVSGLSPTDCNEFSGLVPIDPTEFAYPSTEEVREKKYSWSALCRGAGPLDVQVTVFVCRKVGAGLKYWDPLTGGPDSDWPMPFPVGVSQGGNNDELQITGNETFINDGYTIADDETGRIYRVLERYPSATNTIKLDGAWLGSATGSVWVVPPPFGSGRGPCIAVYQRVIEF